MPLSLLTTITLEGTEEIGINAELTALALIVLLIMTILKFINMAYFAGFYENVHIHTTLFIATLCYIFLLIGLLNHPSEIYATYLATGTIFYSLVWIFWVVEMIELPVTILTGRKQTRFSRD